MAALAVLGVISVLWFPQTQATTLTIYNSSTICARGSNTSSYLFINCQPHHPRSLILVHRTIHGLTPQSNLCSFRSPKEDCCPDPVDPERECVFTNEEEAVRIREKCDGAVSCFLSNVANFRARVGSACANHSSGLTYDSYSYFFHVEYSCVNVDVMSNVCDNNGTVSGREVFVDSNFYHPNQHHADTSCACGVSTVCQQALRFEVLEVALSKNDTSGECREGVSVREGDTGNVFLSLDCDSHSLAASYRQGVGGVFGTPSSVASFMVSMAGNHTGKFLVRVTASNDSPVSVLCGQPGGQDILDSTQCTPALTTPSTPTTSAPTTPASTTPAPTTPAPTTPAPDLSSPTFNSTKEACLQGQGHQLTEYDFSFECTAPISLISVERVLHGVTPDRLGCDSGAPKNSCCPGYDPDRDCLFETTEGLTRLRERCDGAASCWLRLDRATVPTGACPVRHLDNTTYSYDAYSTFAFVEYSCINIGIMSDVCDHGDTTRHPEVYLETNVYHNNRDRANESCSCALSTMCGEQLLFYPLIIDLDSPGGSECTEDVSIIDSVNGSETVHLSCAQNGMDENPSRDRTPVFRSQSNVVDFRLDIHGQHAGKMMIKVVASDGGLVDVRCGRTTSLPVWEQHQCPSRSHPAHTTTTIMTTTTAPFTTTSADNSTENDGKTLTERSDDNSGRDTAIIIAAAIVASLVVIAAIIIIVVICRKPCGNHENESISGEPHVYYSTIDPDDPPAYDNNPPPTLPPPHLHPPATNGHVVKQPYVTEESGGYSPPSPSPLGAEGGIDNPAYVSMVYDVDTIVNQNKSFPSDSDKKF